MRILVLVAIFTAFLLSPVFAVGNLNITSTNLAPTYINTRTVTNMLNLTMNSTNGNTNITAINVTIAGNATVGNITGVFLLNSTGSTIASSTTNSTASKFTVSIPAGFNASSGANTSFVIAINLSGSATKSNVSVQIASSVEFGVDSGSNVTLVSGFVNSTESQIQDIHANVSIYPQFVDTNVINQTIFYIIMPTGRDAIKNITITIPSGYNFTNISTVELDGSNITSNITTTAPNYINVTATTSTTNRIKITFNVNTSSTRVNATAFTSTIDGGNLTGISTDLTSAGSTNVTTQQIINGTNIEILKGAAIVNGTDYWEFNFTLSFSANLAGTIQFKMTNWTDASNTTLGIYSGATYYVTLRNNTNFSDSNGKFNVTNVYGDNNVGVNQSITDSGALKLTLRMVIPLSTKISSTWAATYNFLFRTTP